MSRIVDEDFDKLTEFIKYYSLVKVVNDNDFLLHLKSGHRSYIGLLYLWSHCQFLLSKGKLEFHGIAVEKDNPAMAYLQECVSDVGSSLFCCFHGAYKPAGMALRSGIENFLRFSGGLADENALKTTSVLELFEISAKAPQFLGSAKKFHSQLRALYSELCKDTHTASLDHMGGVHALNHFPKFEPTKFKIWSNQTKQMVVAIGTVLTLASPTLYLKAHFKTKEIIEPILANKDRERILAGRGR
jgi:hypothetical protein